MASSLLFLISCLKKEKAPATDVRDAIVGDYEVWDSLYLYDGMDTLGHPLSHLEGVFHYPVMKISKSRVLIQALFIDDYYTDGLIYNPVIVDTGFVSNKGFKYGRWIYKTEFRIENGKPVKLYNPISDLSSEYFIGKVNGNILNLVSGDGYSRAVCVKIK